MAFEKFNEPTQKPDSSEEAFNKLMAEAQLLEGVSFVEEEGVNIEAAKKLIDHLNDIDANDLPFTSEDDSDAREMVMHLEKMQKMLSPVPQEINTALAQLRLLRNKLHAETV